MKTSPEQFTVLLKKPEGEHLEFKEAKSGFDVTNELPDYCAALANEGGGKLILGVRELKKEKRVEVVGSAAFEGTANKLGARLLDTLHLRVDIEELQHEGKRVVIFHIPGRQTGQLIRSTGKYTYPMRVGESLVEMDACTMRRILNEAEPDFSAEVVSDLGISDLDEQALSRYRELWAEETDRPDYLALPFEEMLRNLDLMKDGKLTNAALILFGLEKTLTWRLPDAEIIFEWRQIPDKTPHDFRRTWRKAAVLAIDEVWSTVNSHNSRFPYQEGLFQYDIWAFSEKPIREAVLNAITHRDYSLRGCSVFITASPREFCIESPGGFPHGITAANILDEHVWRNRLLADALNRVGLVERAGQGLNDIFEANIRAGKGAPVISEEKNFKVSLVIPAQVQDAAFIAYLEKFVNKKAAALSLREILALEKIRVHGSVNQIDFREKFLRLGLIEQVGRTRGARYVLSFDYYEESSRRGEHVRLVGLSRAARKQVIQEYLEKRHKLTSGEVRNAFPELKAAEVSNILQELRRDGVIVHVGPAKGGHWELGRNNLKKNE